MTLVVARGGLATEFAAHGYRLEILHMPFMV